MLQISIADIRAVYYKDDGVTGRVVALPELAETVLSTDVPHLEVHVGHRDCGDILADCRHGLQFWVGVRGEEE